MVSFSPRTAREVNSRASQDFPNDFIHVLNIVLHGLRGIPISGWQERRLQQLMEEEAMVDAVLQVHEGLETHSKEVRGIERDACTQILFLRHKLHPAS